jgi:phosphoenolpyruvate-protein kinase (PTS system EI component)
MAAVAVPSSTSIISRAIPNKETFSPLERELVIAILEETIAQLSVLDAILPSSAKPSATSDVLTEALSEILENQRLLEEQFERLKSTGKKDKNNLRDEVHELSTAAEATHNIQAIADNLEKLKKDQKFLKSVMTNLLHEVASSGTQTSLQNTIHHYITSKNEMEESVKKEQDCRRLIKRLKRQLVDLKKEKEDKILASYLIITPS